MVGGSIANSVTALKEGAYSLTQEGTGNSLRAFYSLTNGDITDSVTGANVVGITDS